MKKRVYSETKAKRKKRSDWEYFDDCLVCQEMKRAEEGGRKLSLEELQELFRKANEQN